MGNKKWKKKETINIDSDFSMNWGLRIRVGLVGIFNVREEFLKDG